MNVCVSVDREKLIYACQATLNLIDERKARMKQKTIENVAERRRLFGILPPLGIEIATRYADALEISGEAFWLWKYRDAEDACRTLLGMARCSVSEAIVISATDYEETCLYWVLGCA